MKRHLCNIITDKMTKQEVGLARERTEWIINHPAFANRSARELLETAYLMGAVDTARVTRKMNKRKAKELTQ